MLTRAISAATLTALVFAAAPADSQATQPLGVLASIPATQELGQLMTRLDLIPENLAAAGCNSSDASTVAADLGEHLLSDPTALDLADETCFDAVSALVEVRTAIRAGEATQAQLDALPGLELAHQAALIARDLLLAAAWSAATASLTETESAALVLIRSNSGWNVDTHFLVIDQTQAQWLELRMALDEQRVALKFGDPVSAESLTIIANALSNEDVARAKVDLESNLASVKAAWLSATS